MLERDFVLIPLKEIAPELVKKLGSKAGKVTSRKPGKSGKTKRKAKK